MQWYTRIEVLNRGELVDHCGVCDCVRVVRLTVRGCSCPVRLKMLREGSGVDVVVVVSWIDDS
jgi:hypothetical protein